MSFFHVLSLLIALVLVCCCIVLPCCVVLFRVFFRNCNEEHLLLYDASPPPPAWKNMESCPWCLFLFVLLCAFIIGAGPVSWVNNETLERSLSGNSCPVSSDCSSYDSCTACVLSPCGYNTLDQPLCGQSCVWNSGRCELSNTATTEPIGRNRNGIDKLSCPSVDIQDKATYTLLLPALIGISLTIFGAVVWFIRYHVWHLLRKTDIPEKNNRDNCLASCCSRKSSNSKNQRLYIPKQSYSADHTSPYTINTEEEWDYPRDIENCESCGHANHHNNECSYLYTRDWSQCADCGHKCHFQFRCKREVTRTENYEVEIPQPPELKTESYHETVYGYVNQRTVTEVYSGSVYQGSKVEHADVYAPQRVKKTRQRLVQVPPKIEVRSRRVNVRCECNGCSCSHCIPTGRCDCKARCRCNECIDKYKVEDRTKKRRRAEEDKQTGRLNAILDAKKALCVLFIMSSYYCIIYSLMVVFFGVDWPWTRALFGMFYPRSDFWVTYNFHGYVGSFIGIFWSIIFQALCWNLAKLAKEEIDETPKFSAAVSFVFCLGFFLPPLWLFNIIGWKYCNRAVFMSLVMLPIFVFSFVYFIALGYLIN